MAFYCQTSMVISTDPSSHSVPPLLNTILSLPTRPLWQKVLRCLAGWALGLLATCWVLTLLAWGGMHWLILPHIDAWRAEIQGLTTRVLGVPVRLGSIQVQSRGWSPTIELRDVVLTDAQRRPALVLPKVVARLSPRSVLALEPRFRQVVIDGANLEIERDQQGRIFVAGLPLPLGSDKPTSKGLAWLLRQGEVAIRGGTVRWTDLQRPAPAVILSDVQWVLRNRLRKHAMRLDASPPAQWGQRLSVQGEFQQALLADSADWRQWSGTLYSDIPQLDLGQIKHYVQLPFALEQGQGALRGWLDVAKGLAVGGTLDLALQTVNVQLDAQASPLVLQRLEGRVSGTQSGNTTHLNLSQLGFVTQAGQTWSPSDTHLGWQRSLQGELSGGEIRVKRLDLGLMTQMAAHMPLSMSLRQELAQAQVLGVAQDLEISWEGPMQAPGRYQLKGMFSNLSIEAFASPLPLMPSPAQASAPQVLGRPGIRGAILDIAATEKGGQAQLQVIDGGLTWPGLWEDPSVPLSQLSATLQWHIEPSQGLDTPKLTVELMQAQVTNDDVQGEAQATWTRLPAPADQFNPGILDLTAQVHRGRADKVVRYLPQRLGGRAYLASALSGGSISQGHVRVRGDLKDFPFRSPPGSAPAKSVGGEMLIKARVDDLSFAYIPNKLAPLDQPTQEPQWPLLSGVAGELLVEHGGIAFRNVSAKYRGVSFSNIRADIKNLSPSGVLVLEAQGGGPLADMLQFVNASPLDLWSAHAQARAQSDGLAVLKLSLNLPLADTQSTTLKGSLILPGNRLQWSPELPALTQLEGRIDFTQRSLTLSTLKAQLLGGEIQIQGGWQPEMGLKLLAQGRLNAEGLRQANEWPEMARWARYLSGETSYRLMLGVVHGHPEVLLTSDGLGLSIDLPAPLTKSAQTPWAMQLQTLAKAPETGAGRVVADTVNLSLGPMFQAQYARDLRGANPLVTQGQIWLGTKPGPLASAGSASTARTGVSAQISAPSIDLDAWRMLLTQASSAMSNVSSTQAASSYVPTRLMMQAKELAVAARKFSNFSVDFERDDNLWRAKVDADQLNGLFTYQPMGPNKSAQIMVRLSRLNLPSTDAALKLERQNLTSSISQPNGAAPNLDIVIEDFAWRDRKLGRLEMEAISTPAVGHTARDWRLSRLLLSTPEARLTASGQWAAVAERGSQSQARQVVVDFKLELSDSGAFIERLGMGQTIRGGKGLMAGQLAWYGAPTDLELGLLSGQMNIDLERGQFLKAEPGAARLLGVLSLQSLPRRLVLDFRDVFQEGFAFDGITGDVKLAQGIASTNNFRMRGVQAVVLMEGQADLNNETQDLRVVVVPELNAGTASLAYAVINPALGLGTFLAQLFLRKPLTQASTREFRIQGGWADPQVTKLDNLRGLNVTAPP